MTHANAGRHGAEILILDAAILTGVIFLLGTLVKFVLSFSRVIRMPRTRTGSQSSNGSERNAAVFTKKLGHSFEISLTVMGNPYG